MVALPLFPVQVWGAGGSLKVTILQSSDSRAFSTVPLTPVPRAGDSTSATPASANTPSKQTLQFFCYLCKASCSSQQVPASQAPARGEGRWAEWRVSLADAQASPRRLSGHKGPVSTIQGSCAFALKTVPDQPRS